MKTIVNYTTMSAIIGGTHSWLTTGSLPRVLRDVTTVGGIDQYNIYYTTDAGEEGFWQNYGKIGSYISDVFNPVADGVNIIMDMSNNYFIRQSGMFDGEINVKWFGAMGDADNYNPYPNDDIDAIQSAIDFLGNTYYTGTDGTDPISCGTVYFPKATYKISSTILVPAGIRLIGESTRVINSLQSFRTWGHATIIACFFADNPNQWAVSSATYTYGSTAPGSLLQFDEALTTQYGQPYYFNDYITRQGIHIENLTFYGAKTSDSDLNRDDFAFGCNRQINMS